MLLVAIILRGSTSELEVYGTTLVVMVESVIEGIVSHSILVSNRGNLGLFVDPFTIASIIDNLHPVFSAFRTC